VGRRLAFGTPTRFGNPAAQLNQYLDMAGGVWFNARSRTMPSTTFTSALYPDGGLESTILALNNVFDHESGRGRSGRQSVRHRRSGRSG
jgi:NAD(P)H dehydrogenase (quinone)